MSEPPKPRRFATYDVFTTKPLSGNPLAIVHDADGLDTDAMQRIAAEFNLSETVFLLPAAKPFHTARARIFTPNAELPFAGHPTVGTVIHLARERLGESEREQDMIVVLEEEVGPVRAAVVLRPGEAAHALFDLPRLPEPVAGSLEKDEISAALGLANGEIGFENHKPVRYSAGVPFSFVPVRDLGVMESITLNPAGWAAAFGEQDHNNAFVYTRQTVHHDSAFHARMFWPGMGISEDPATGAAVAAFAGVIHRFDDLVEGEHRFVIEQGYEMGRPSEIILEIDISNGKIDLARIGGSAVQIASGELLI